MIYYDARVVDPHGIEVARFYLDAKTDEQAIDLAKRTFRYQYPHSNLSQYHFCAKLFQRIH